MCFYVLWDFLMDTVGEKDFLGMGDGIMKILIIGLVGLPFYPQAWQGSIAQNAGC